MANILLLQFYSSSKIVKLMHEREVAGYVPKDFPGQARTLCLTQHWSGIRIVLLLLRLKAMIDLLLSRIKMAGY